MTDILINDFTIVTLAGLIGVIDYWVFNQLNLFNFFDNTNTDEKAALIILLGLANLFIYQLLAYLTNLNIWLILILGTILAKIIVFLFFYSVKLTSDKIKDKYFENKRKYKYYGNSLKEFLDKEDSDFIYVYIFDFENNLIEDGYIDSHSVDESNNNKDLSINLPDDYKFYKKSDGKTDELFNDFEETYIDFGNQIKIYIVRINKDSID